MWRLNGKKTDFERSTTNADFSWQHHVRAPRGVADHGLRQRQHQRPRVGGADAEPRRGQEATRQQLSTRTSIRPSSCPGRSAACRSEARRQRLRRLGRAALFLRVLQGRGATRRRAVREHDALVPHVRSPTGTGRPTDKPAMVARSDVGSGFHDLRQLEWRYGDRPLDSAGRPGPGLAAAGRFAAVDRDSRRRSSSTAKDRCLRSRRSTATGMNSEGPTRPERPLTT